MKSCYTCSEIKPLSEYHKKKSSIDGVASVCKTCRNKQLRAWRQTNKGKECIRKQNNKPSSILSREKYSKTKIGKTAQRKGEQAYKLRNENKRKAKAKVNNALITGKISKVDTCEMCGNSEFKTEAHHWSYNEEHWLNVLWVCRKCHNNIHKGVK